MIWLEAEIERYQNRIRRIEANPDPTKLKCNRLLYELERDFRKAQLQAWRLGKLFASGEHVSCLVPALGFVNLDLVGAADRVTLASPFFDILRAKGFPDDACDRTIVCIAMCINGDFPPPNFMVATNMACEMELTSFKAIGEYFRAPVFCLDIGLRANEDTLRYVTAQLEELIEFAQEKVPGARYDEQKLVELLESDRVAFDCMRNIHELRKHVPCLISGQDAFRIPRLPSHYHDPAKAVEYFRAYRDEMLERAEKGFGVLEDEKLRFLWVVTGPYYFDPFNFLARRGVAVPALQYGVMTRWYGAKYGVYGDETEYGRKLSPLEEQARMVNRNSWGGLGERWLRNTLDLCQDLRIDAMVYFMQVGCTASAGLGQLVAQRAEEELGIPTLLLEGRQLDREYKSQAEMEAELGTFVDICLARKGARQKPA